VIVKIKKALFNPANLYTMGASILDAHPSFVYGTGDKLVADFTNITGIVKSDLKFEVN